MVGQMLFSLVVSLLLFLGFGYLIIIFANKEKKIFKTAGLVIGWAIVTIAVVSFLSGLVSVWAAKDMCRRSPEMKMMMKK